MSRRGKRHISPNLEFNLDKFNNLISQMKKIIFLLIGLNLSAQNVSKEQFVNTEWFSDNSNQKFYKSDTIYLRQLLHYECDYKTLSRAHIIRK